MEQIKISIFAKKPAKGGTPAKLKKASKPVKPKTGFNKATEETSIKVLLLWAFFVLFNEKTKDHKQILVSI